MQPSSSTSLERQLLEIVQDADVTLHDAHLLLTAGQGELQQAVNLFYDGQLPQLQHQHRQPHQQSVSGSPATSPPAPPGSSSSPILSKRANADDVIELSGDDDDDADFITSHPSKQLKTHRGQAVGVGGREGAGKRGAAGRGAAGSGRKTGSGGKGGGSVGATGSGGSNQRSLASFWAAPKKTKDTAQAQDPANLDASVGGVAPADDTRAGPTESHQPAVPSDAHPNISPLPAAGNQDRSGNVSGAPDSNPAVEPQRGVGGVVGSVAPPPAESLDHASARPTEASTPAKIEPVDSAHTTPTKPPTSPAVAAFFTPRSKAPRAADKVPQHAQQQSAVQHAQPQQAAQGSSGRAVFGVSQALAPAPTGPKYSPSAVTLPAAQYDPVAHAGWVAGSPAPWSHVVDTMVVMDSTTKRLEIANALTNMFRSLLALSPGDIVPTLYLCTSRIGAAHEPGGEMHVGGATVSSALCEVTGVTRAKMRQMFHNMGDLGDVAQACKRSQVTLRTPTPLTISGLMNSLRAMARDTGPGSANRKQGVVARLLRSTRSEFEIKYLVRLLIQNLRVGANWKSLIGPLARAVTLHREGVRNVSKARLDAAAAAASAAYHLCPSWDALVPALIEGGAEGLSDRCAMVPGVPIKPQLARICEGFADAVRLLGQGSFLAEYKYDGRRAQIHLLLSGAVKIFSRNSEDSTAAFPDVARLMRQAAGLPPDPHPTTSTAATINPRSPDNKQHQQHNAPATESASGQAPTAVQPTQPPVVVIDSEIVGVERDPVTGRVMRVTAFQELATRARGQVSAAEVTQEVCVFVFDLLHYNGQTLLHRPLRERLALLPAALPHMRPGFIQPAQHHEIVLGSWAQPPAEIDPATGTKRKGRGKKQAPGAQETTTTTAAAAAQSPAPASVPGGRAEDVVAEDVEVVSLTDEDDPNSSGGESDEDALHGGDVHNGDDDGDGDGGGGGGGDDAGMDDRYGGETGTDVRSFDEYQSGGEAGGRAGLSQHQGDINQAAGGTSETTTRAAAVLPTTSTAGQTDTDAMDAAFGDTSAQAQTTATTTTAVPVISMESELGGLSAGAAGVNNDPGALGLAATDASTTGAAGAGTDTAAPADGGGGQLGVPVCPENQEAAEELLLNLMIQAHEAGTEGLMLKRLDGPASTYEPSKRSDSWIKLKRDYCEGLRDSLDLVVIGAWQGVGRKVAWLSPFLLAAYDPVTETLQSVCRCMSGFTDAFYQEASQRLMATRIKEPKSYVNTGESCHYWFEPKEVWEVRGAELSLSPVHRAAVGQVPGSDRGLALRFPRFIRVRDDKSVEDATGPDTLIRMYMAQNRRVATDK